MGPYYFVDICLFVVLFGCDAAIGAALIIILYVFGNSWGRIEQLGVWIWLPPLPTQDPSHQEVSQTHQATSSRAHFLPEARFPLLHPTGASPVRCLWERGPETDQTGEVLEGRDRSLLQTHYWLAGTTRPPRHTIRGSTLSSWSHRNPYRCPSSGQGTLLGAVSIRRANQAITDSKSNLSPSGERLAALLGSLRGQSVVEGGGGVAGGGLSGQSSSGLHE